MSVLRRNIVLRSLVCRRKRYEGLAIVYGQHRLSMSGGWLGDKTQ